MDGPRVSSEHGNGPPSAARVTPEVAAEAAVWIARLHGPDRSPQMERECLAWQARSASHRLAFERCSDTWGDVPGVRLADAYAAASSRAPTSEAGGRAWGSMRARWAIAVALAVGVVGGGLWGERAWRETGIYATAVGEQRLVVLEDGSRMSLNTDTRARVNFGPSLRSVTVQGGEALFEVAKDPKRPFIVRVGGSEVVAVGTTFSVRLAGDGAHADGLLAVTLIEGQVTVRPVPGSAVGSIAPARPLAMQAGERMRLAKAADAPTTEHVDRPSIEQVVAWKRSEAIFDDVSLADAVAEMNRYNRTPIVLVGSSSLAQLRVSGLYRTGDSAGFARAVAALHGLVARERAGRLELAPPP